MKVLFVNPPCVRSEGSNPGNNFRLDGIPIPNWIRGIRGGTRLWLASGLGGTIRYGVRAGSRWPWSLPAPTWGSPNYPFMMGYAAAQVASAGHVVTIFDSVAEQEYHYARFLRRVRDWQPDLIVQECSTPTIDIDIWLSKALSEIAPLALGGPHLSDTAVLNELRQNNPHIRFFLQGEYANGALELVSTMRPGVYPVSVVADVDAIPFAFRDFPAATRYFEPTMPTARPQLQVYGSKGCPFKCTFCVWPQAMYQKKVSLRAPEKIAEEIRSAVASGGYRSILFDDDTFNMGTPRISRLCDLLKEIGLPWTMMGRIDISPDWLYEKMIDSGCVGMRFGIETFDLDVLARVKKGIERKDFRAALERLCRDYPDLMLHITMMRDMPGQTEEAHQRDMSIIRGLGFTERDMRRSYQLSRCAPFPGTELYYQLKSAGHEGVLGDFAKYDGSRDTVMKEVNG